MSEYVIFFYILKIFVNFIGIVIIIGGGWILIDYKEGEIYVVGIEVFNVVGLFLVNWMDGVIIDSLFFEVNDLKLIYDLNNDFVSVLWIVKDD